MVVTASSLDRVRVHQGGPEQNVNKVYSYYSLHAFHLGGSVFCNFYRVGVFEQALSGIPYTVKTETCDL